MNKEKLLRLGRLSYRLALGTLRVVPRGPALAWGAGMGWVAYRLGDRVSKSGHRAGFRVVAENNLKLAFGDSLSARDRDRLLLRVFQNFSRAWLVDFVKAPALTSDQVRTLVKADTLQPLADAVARGRGVILIAAHLGHWEMLYRRIAVDGFHVAVIVRQGNDPTFIEITNWARQNGGYTVFPRGFSAWPQIKHLRGGGILAIPADQKSDDVFVPFFGIPAGTVAGPAVLALKTGAAILPMFAPRQPDGTYRVEFLPEVDTHVTGDTAADVRRIMADITTGIEEMVRRYPDQWLWLHDRWRLPPGGIPEKRRGAAA